MADKKTKNLLIGLMMVFILIIILSVFGLYRNETLFGLGIPANYENWMIIILSVGSIVKIVFDFRK